MVATVQAPALLPALATGIGSLPHTDPVEAAELVLRVLPRLPAVPQLPRRDSREGMVAQWLSALDEVDLAPDGSFTLSGPAQGSPVASFDEHAHAGLLGFLEVAASAEVPPARVKVQCTGPLTLGLALVEAGMPPSRAFPRAAEAARVWIDALEVLVTSRLPAASLLVFLDEPALVTWRMDPPPIPRDRAIDLLSGVLATIAGTSGVHVCGDGDRRLALEAGPHVVALDVERNLSSDGDGWVAWGVVPADRPVGSSPEPLWRSLVETWCELTRRGCDPVRLRTQSLITPSCGLAGHSPAQAEHLLELTHVIAERVHGQAMATRLTLGA